MSRATFSTPVADFFAHHDFLDLYNPSESASSNFRRLVQTKGWRNGTLEHQWAEGSLKQALLAQFNEHYGEEETLERWLKICERLGLDVRGVKTMVQAREKVLVSHFHLVDLAEAKDGQRVRTFRTEKELKKYAEGQGLDFTTEADNPCITGAIVLQLLRREG